MSKVRPPHIYIDIINEQIGLGVFAARAFFKNEVIEEAPIFILKEKYPDIPTEFQNRVFRWGAMTGTEADVALALGYGSIYIHSDRPNLTYEADDQNKILRFKARRAIDPGEQLTIHYNQENDGALPTHDGWFEKEGIEKIDI